MTSAQDGLSDAESVPPVPPRNAEEGAARHDPYEALRCANYLKFISGWVVSSTGLQMLGMAIGWEIYERTGSVMALGVIGLARALPVLIFALPAGHAVDLYDRKRVLVLTQLAFAVLGAVLAAASYVRAPIEVMYGLLVLTGCARVFNGPSRSSLLPLIVPPETFHNAVTWNSAAFQLSATAGPILAGLIIARFGVAWPVYACMGFSCLLFSISAAAVKPRASPRSAGRFTWGSMLAGMAHVRREKTVLAAITLDLFAVLLGGATALMPVYAKDILHVGPQGLGVLRAAPFVGSFAMALVLAHRPPFLRAGRALLWSVALFGAATVVFGLSTNFALSLGMLFALGAMDQISIVVRHVLVQVRTPDALRGRVSAVNSLFIESSNELGGFESGAVASIFGPVVSVVSGGIGTILVVIGVAWAWPEVRRLGRLREEEGTGG